MVLDEQRLFITNLKYYRRKKNYSQQQLAELCDVSNGTIGNIETGITKPSFDLIIKLSSVLCITPDKFFINNEITKPIFSDKQLDYLYDELKKELIKNLNDSINKTLTSLIEKNKNDV